MFHERHRFAALVYTSVQGQTVRNRHPNDVASRFRDVAESFEVATKMKSEVPVTHSS